MFQWHTCLDRFNILRFLSLPDHIALTVSERHNFWHPCPYHTNGHHASVSGQAFREREVQAGIWLFPIYPWICGREHCCWLPTFPSISAVSIPEWTQYSSLFVVVSLCQRWSQLSVSPVFPPLKRLGVYPLLSESNCWHSGSAEDRVQACWIPNLGRTKKYLSHLQVPNLDTEHYPQNFDGVHSLTVGKLFELILKLHDGPSKASQTSRITKWQSDFDSKFRVIANHITEAHHWRCIMCALLTLAAAKRMTEHL